MQDVKLIFTTTPMPSMPEGAISYSHPMWLHSPEFREEHGEGWRVLSHQVVGQRDNDLILSFLLSRDLDGDLADALRAP